MKQPLTRSDLLREEALLRAREVHGLAGNGDKPEDVLKTAEEFYTFLQKGE